MCTLNSPEEVWFRRPALRHPSGGEGAIRPDGGGNPWPSRFALRGRQPGARLWPFAATMDGAIGTLRPISRSPTPSSAILLAGPDREACRRGCAAPPSRFTSIGLANWSRSWRGTGAISGAIVMEPMRHDLPEDGFLEKVRALADETGAVLVFDEVTSGWRTHFGGLHLRLGVYAGHRGVRQIHLEPISHGGDHRPGSVMEAARSRHS